MVRWGNGYGIRLTKKEAAALEAEPGDELDIDLYRPRFVTEAELDRLAMFNFGKASSIGHDEAAEADLAEDMKRWYDGNR